MEFKKLSDVEIVTELAESANVLIEEDGVIKKAPKTAVGGAGGANWDAIFEVVEGSSGFFSSVSLVLGDFDTLASKVRAGTFPKVLIRYAYDLYSVGVLNPDSILLKTDDQGNSWYIRFSFICDYNQRGFKLYENGETSYS